MTENTTTDFFDGVGGGSGAPSAQLANVGDFVHGEILEMYKRDYVPYENRKSKEPARNPDGSAVQQLVVVLQTTERNWANVSKVPVVDPADPNSPVKDPAEDDGKRAIYVPQGKNIQFAIGRAVTAAQAKFEVGGTLGVKIANLRDTGKGNPLKEHEAVYKAKPAQTGAEFFGGDQQAAPAAAPAPAAPAAEPAPAPAAPQAAPAAAPSQDPWATPAAPATSQPPF